jgi:hypothetical protein
VTKAEHAASEARKRDAVVEAALKWHSHQYGTHGSPIHLAISTVALCDAINDLRSTFQDEALFEKYGWDGPK